MGDTAPPKNELKAASQPTSSETIRESMVNTAVSFLQNPKVQGSPLQQKRAFLVSKGLTNEEINKAIERASSTSFAPVPVQHPSYMGVNTIPQPVYRRSFWSRVNGYTSAIIILGIAFYGVRQFYKLYIEPLLYGEKKQEDKLSKMEEQLLEVSRSLSQLRKSVSIIEVTLESQKEQLQKYLSGKNVELEDCISPSVFLELRADLSTVKSLLLNRHQFPEVPKFGPSIPTWQLGSGSDRKDMREVELLVESDQAAEVPNSVECNGDPACADKVKELNETETNGDIQINEDILIVMPESGKDGEVEQINTSSADSAEVKTGCDTPAN